MRIYIDSAVMGDIEAALETGFVYGVTTNPTLLQRAGVRRADVPALAERVFDLGAQEMHVQVYAEDTPHMVSEGRELFSIAPGMIAVKIPATAEGFKAAAELAREGVPVTLTAVYTVAQAVLAQSVEARYIAVYLGRMRDAGMDAVELVGRMQQTLNAYKAQVDILAASIRAPADVEQLGERGVAMVTLPLTVLKQLTDSEQTAAAASTFAEAARML